LFAAEINGLEPGLYVLGVGPNIREQWEIEPMTCNDFTSRFKNAQEVQDFETRALSIGNEFLPECARTVRDGGDPTPAYWTWLCGQVDKMEEDAP
jgi:hypothetical protein